MVKGLGVDLIEVERIRGLLQRRGEAFYRKIFTSQEAAYCLSKKSPAVSTAARFAAKEAVFKALGVSPGRCRWQEIEVVRGLRGKPEVVLHGNTREHAQNSGLEKVLLTISHDRKYAVAFAVAV